MGTLQKSQKCHEKSISTRYFAKNTDFQLLNGFDHVYEAIRAGSWKIVIFEPKIIRIDENHQKWTRFLPNHLVLVFKTVFKTAIFRKILDGDLTKIAKMSRKMHQHKVLRENPWFSCSERLWSRIRGSSDQKLKKTWFLNTKSSESITRSGGHLVRHKFTAWSHSEIYLN